MKKNSIFMVSLIAILAAVPANAEIASSAYVNAVVSPVKTKIDNHIADTDVHVTTEQKATWSAKQDAISDLATIRAGAAAGATAVQAVDLGNAAVENVATSITENGTGLATSGQVYAAVAAATGDASTAISNLDYAGNNAAGVVTNVTQEDGVITATKAKVTTSEIADNAGILKTQLDSNVQTSLGKADTAVQGVVEGSTNGTISVDGTPVAVHGLGSAAYTNASAYDAAGAATSAQNAATAAAQQYTDSKIGPLGSHMEGDVVFDYNVRDYVDDKVAAVSNSVNSLGDLAELDAVAEENLTSELANKINGKQNAISDLATIRAGAAAGATAVQASGITTGTTNGTISVNGTPVAVHGLGSAAYTASTDYAPSSMKMLPTITEGASDGQYTLTAKVENGTVVYAWEAIGR